MPATRALLPRGRGQLVPCWRERLPNPRGRLLPSTRVRHVLILFGGSWTSPPWASDGEGWAFSLALPEREMAAGLGAHTPLQLGRALSWGVVTTCLGLTLPGGLLSPTPREWVSPGASHLPPPCPSGTACGPDPWCPAPWSPWGVVKAQGANTQQNTTKQTHSHP